MAKSTPAGPQPSRLQSSRRSTCSQDTAGPLATVRGLSIDESYMRRVVEHLSSIGSSSRGFRTTGTPEDAAVASFVADEMAAIGLADVAVEEVEVDGWRFKSATVEVDGATYEGASFGGVPPTPPGGLRGRLVDVGTGRRRTLSRLDLAGAVALLDWRDSRVAPSAVAVELANRGAVAIVMNCPDKGPWYQSPGALGAFDGQWVAPAPPMVTLRSEDVVALRARLREGPADAHLTLDADMQLRTQGRNVVGYWPGERPGPIVVGAHHDGWFYGAFDNASGVAAMLAIARAVAGSGHHLRHTVCFTTRTGEEYGIANSFYDWCIGAWEQVTTTHPEWSVRAPFHLCVEATGHHDLRMLVETPVELAAWARRTTRAAADEGWLPMGWRLGPPSPGTELWPFLVAGVPSVAAYAWGTPFSKTDYHTQLDTVSILDFGYMAMQARFYALLIMEADRQAETFIDQGARARQLSAIARDAGRAGEPLAAAARHHREAAPRAAFKRVGRGLVALDQRNHACYPHAQIDGDIASMDAALTAIDAGDGATAARHLRKVGAHSMFPYLSEPAFAAYNGRGAAGAVARSWARRSHLTTSPGLWRELSTLEKEPGSRPDGPWLRSSISAAAGKARDERDRRLLDMARAVGPRPGRPAEREDHTQLSMK